jgi:hypothetical protein
MADQKRFRLILPGGLASLDTFVPADVQPHRIRAGCVLMMHEASGREIIVHASRLAPVDAEAAEHHTHRVCLNCGKVEGIVEDGVVCLHDEGVACVLVEPVAEHLSPPPPEPARA